MCGCLSSEPDTPSDAPDAAEDCDSATQSCPLANLFVHVRQNDELGPAVAGADIEVAEVDAAGPPAYGGQSDGPGDASWLHIPARRYRIRASLDGLVPEPASAEVQTHAGTDTHVTLVLTPVEFHLHVDADRDGAVDDDRSGLDQWHWGRGNKGAVVLCNDDGDGSRTRSDNQDDQVNAGNDRDELAPLVLRRTGPAPPPGWQGVLELDAAVADKVRVFASRSAGAREILGPARGSSHTLPDLNFTEKEFGIEALRYAGSGWENGEIDIRLRLTRTSGSSVTEAVKLRVAPWLMPNHLNAAEKVFVVDAGAENARFRGELGAIVATAGCTLQQHPEGGDIWMQDCMEWGFATLPAGRGIRSVMRAPRDRPLKVFPETLRHADLGYGEPAALARATVNSTGNLEVTPPVTSAAGKVYPCGRIYYGPGRPGELISADFETFLKKQVVQAPITIDTAWLTVAHVDEIISTVPSPGPKGFKLLLASPKLGYEILERQQRLDPSARMLVGRRFDDPVTGTDVEVTVGDFLSNGLPALKAKFTAAYLKTFNTAKQAQLDAIRARLESELGLTAADIVPVPSLFADIVAAGLADALTGGMVNMLVINRHCVFAKPFGPVAGGVDLFEDDLAAKLRAEGLTPHPIDDWYEYHVALGEVHCGTNTLRAPTTPAWWEFEP